ncbi:unnamed protein product [Trifolium pratense]|uniref:Uncharacterized protein n=1 Tax=Trifolium pratense TaxID=57577 RepID=A0ACB0JKL5_TRIPR|nr:unnamed protein product [Trifolium pratense]
MSDTEEVMESQGAERYRLFDTITDPKLDWVGPEPRGIASVLTRDDPKLHTVVERRRRNDPVNWLTYMPDEDQRVCSSFDEHGFAMYKFVFKELRVVRPTLPLFLRVFNIQCKSTRGEDRAVPRQNWVSLKQQDDVRLFKMFTDYVRHFKERYYIVRPESPAARDNLLEPRPDLDDNGVVRRDAAGRVLTRMELKFPLSWTYVHFHKGHREYMTREADLSAEDKASFEDVKSYVDGFTPTEWVNKRGEIILDEDGNPRTSKRFINTRELLECRNTEEAAANEKASGKEKKKMKDAATGEVPDVEKVIILEQEPDVRKKQHARDMAGVIRMMESALVFGDERDSLVGERSALQGRTKELRLEKEKVASLNGQVEQLTTAMVPSKDKHKAAEGLTTRAELVQMIAQLSSDVVGEVPDVEKVIILEQEPDVRKKQHARDMAGVIRMMESALVFGDERDSLVGERSALQGRTTELRLEKEKVASLNGQVEQLTTAMVPSKDKHKAAEGLTTRAELVQMIAQLSSDVVGARLEQVDPEDASDADEEYNAEEDHEDNPARKASYSAWLFEVGKDSASDSSISIPSSFSRMILAPAPVALDAPSTKIVHLSASSIEGDGLVISAMKLART